ncbi:hypothetical protein ACWD3J_47470 [Streptomyces sp. NPDC002755]|uniref:hypothetical protein n=1 Tax=Streptomyces sp. NPDC002884 TaxID=3154544 RepID=UPI003325A0BD
MSFIEEVALESRSSEAGPANRAVIGKLPQPPLQRVKVPSVLTKPSRAVAVFAGPSRRRDVTRSVATLKELSELRGGFSVTKSLSDPSIVDHVVKRDWGAVSNISPRADLPTLSLKRLNIEVNEKLSFYPQSSNRAIPPHVH